ncbi:hypothetical protein ACMHYB_05065 [Sorangium sp. So ce1128]
MKIRGSALMHTRTYLQTRWGSQSISVLDSKLPASVRAVFSSPDLVAHSWYPVSVWNAIADEISRWPNKSGVIRDLAAYVAEQDLTLAHKVLLKLGTPALVMRQAGVMWGMYFNGGRLAPFAEGERFFRLILYLGVDPQADPGRQTCRDAVPAWQENALRLSGARGGQSLHTRCRFEGHPTCEYEVRWLR